MHARSLPLGATRPYVASAAQVSRVRAQLCPCKQRRSVIAFNKKGDKMRQVRGLRAAECCVHKLGQRPPQCALQCS